MYTNDTERLFAEGGMNDQGGTVDPVSGNDVPPGSLQNEVRDDISAKLSEGEFVIPADVVRYIGLERLMKLRDEAKQGLSRMSEIGQMGNADQVENPEALHEDEEGFNSEIDDIMQEVDGEAMGEKRFAVGGYAESGVDILSKYNIPRTSLTNPALDVRAYKNKEGRVMYITFFNGKPSIAIPPGYEYVSSAAQLLAETKPQVTKITAADIDISGGVGGGGGVGGDSVSTGSGGADVTTSTGISGTSIGNSAIGVAIGAIANAISSMTSTNAPTSVAVGSINSAGIDSSTAEGLATNAAALGIDDASISIGVTDGPGPGSVGIGDGGATGSGSVSDSGISGDGGATGSGSVGDSGVGAGDGGGGVGAGDGGGGAGAGTGLARGGLVSKRIKKPTLAQKRGIASKR
jgi:hypothetical protein